MTDMTQFLVQIFIIIGIVIAAAVKIKKEGMALW